MVRYKDSLEDLLGFSRSMDRMLSSILLQEVNQRSTVWRPPTDVYESEGKVVIVLEIAGMDPDQINVSFEDRILRVSGIRQDQHRRANCHCLEIQYGEFVSEVFLPGDYDRDAIEAHYKDGFLTITLPKVVVETKQIPLRERQ